MPDQRIAGVGLGNRDIGIIAGDRYRIARHVVVWRGICAVRAVVSDARGIIDLRDATGK